jgi:hypothetical protein
MGAFRVKYCAAQLHELWARGASYDEVAAALGCSRSFVHKLKKRHMLPNRQRTPKQVFAEDPTPEQIAERAAECRAKRVVPEPKEARYSVPRYTWDGYRFEAIP